MNSALRHGKVRTIHTGWVLVLILLLSARDDAFAQQRGAPHRTRPAGRAHPARPAADRLAIVTQVDRAASFPNFFSYLAATIRYPDAAREERAQGKVWVAFLVGTDGRVTNVSVHRSSGHRLLDEEAVRVIRSMPQWHPAEAAGKNVSSSFLVPVNFALQN